MGRLFNKVVIIGVGIIGGSLGMALFNRNLAEKIVGIDVDSDNLKLAVETDAIGEGYAEPETAVQDADLVVIATPVGLTIDVLKQIVPFISPGCIITDVGSTKRKIVTEAERLMPEGTFFIGGHPMTGSETTGVKGADKYLFENAVYVLTPTLDTNPQALNKIRKMIGEIGAKVIEIDSGEHDLMVAAVSHLPHLAATALVNTVGLMEKEHKNLLMLAAGGFRDTTRVASGHPMMWKDICLTNKDSILNVLDNFRDVLEEIRRMISDCDDGSLHKAFTDARELRSSIPSKLRGYLPLEHEILVTVPDKPGVIGQMAGILGEAGININDIEVLRVREGEGGTIRLAVGNSEEQEQAVNILRRNGISVRKK